jgi:hypothetical protein
MITLNAFSGFSAGKNQGMSCSYSRAFIFSENLVTPSKSYFVLIAP